MKSVMIISLWLVGALGASVSPLADLSSQTLDARPEALVTGGMLLMLASILRRGQRAKATRGKLVEVKAVEILSAGR